MTCLDIKVDNHLIFHSKNVETYYLQKYHHKSVCQSPPPKKNFFGNSPQRITTPDFLFVNKLSYEPPDDDEDSSLYPPLYALYVRTRLSTIHNGQFFMEKVQVHKQSWGISSSQNPEKTFFNQVILALYSKLPTMQSSCRLLPINFCSYTKL